MDRREHRERRDSTELDALTEKLIGAAIQVHGFAGNSAALGVLGALGGSLRTCFGSKVSFRATPISQDLTAVARASGIFGPRSTSPLRPP